MKTLIEKYLSSKPFTAKTCRVHGIELKNFEKHLRRHGRGLADIRMPDDLETYHDALMDAGKSPATLKRVASTITGFFKWHAKKTGAAIPDRLTQRGGQRRFYSKPWHETPEFTELLDGFFEFMRRPGTDKTALAYSRSVRAFFAQVKKAPADVTQDDVTAWKNLLTNDQGLSVGTVQNYAAAVRKFNAYLKRTPPWGDKIINPLFIDKEGLDMGRAAAQHRRVDDVFTAGELKQFFNVMAREARAGSVLASRDLALFSLLYVAALRLAEPLQITPADIDTTAPSITLPRGRKNKRAGKFEIPADSFIKEDAVYFSRVQSWIDLAGIGPDQPVFCRVPWNRKTRTHEPAPGTVIGARQPQYRFDHWAAAAGIIPAKGRSLTVHSLRHTRATYLCHAKKWNLARLRDFLAHADVSTTSQYLSGKWVK